MAIDIEIFKKTTKISAIFGAGLSLFALIPPLMPVISLFILPFLSAIIILLIIKFTDKQNQTKTFEMKDYAVLGGVAGAISGFIYLIIFTPLVILIHLFIKEYYTYGINYLNFFIAMVFIVTISIILLITNSVGGLLTGFLIRQNLIKQFDQFDIFKKEQK